MKVGIILLSQDDMYVDNYGRLPTRPDFDKKLLLALCKGQTAVAGPNTRESLPKSVFDNLNGFTTWDADYDINLGIQPLINFPPHLLLVVRSKVMMRHGKSFDLSGFDNYYQNGELEIWINRLL